MRRPEAAGVAVCLIDVYETRREMDEYVLPNLECQLNLVLAVEMLPQIKPITQIELTISNPHHLVYLRQNILT